MGLQWTPPDDGIWEQDGSNFPHPLTPIAQDILRNGIEAGWARGARRYGVAMDVLRIRFVHGYCYLRLEWAPGRDEVAQRAIDDRLWLRDAERWEATWRAAWFERLLALQGEQLDAYDDAALADHLRRAVAAATEAFADHMELHYADMIPFGRLRRRCAEWGVDDTTLTAAMRGLSPSSSVAPELTRLAEAARRWDGEGPASVADLRTLDGDAVDRYLRLYGWRVASRWDADGLTVGELPDLLVETVRTRLSSPARDGSADGGEELRAVVPAEHHDELDVVLAETRATFGLRDDNTGPTMQWPIGLVRRALLEVQRRRPGLAVFEAGLEEIVALLAGDAGAPPIAELAERAAARAAARRARPPRVFGDVDADPGPPIEEGSPVAELTLDMLAYFELMGGGADKEPLHGHGVGGTTFVGVACVATTPDEALDRVEAGQVLVCRTTAPAYDAALAIAGALVVEAGGLLSHAALVARELGLPAVVGAREATTIIKDGDRVEVDPVAGAVRVLA